MKRPSFQFYAGDWRSSTSLSRCSHHLKGIWIDTLCLMHDSEEYGVLRWPLEDIAQAVGCSVSDLRLLQEKGVLKGADSGEQCEPYVYTPRHARQEGDPITLIITQPGPIWYSSRMVMDEYKRKNAGASTRFGANPLKSSPAQRDGERHGDNQGVGQGDGSSSSSSSSSSKYKYTKKENPENLYPELFLHFWEAYPRTRRGNRDKTYAAWKQATTRATAEEILAG